VPIVDTGVGVIAEVLHENETQLWIGGFDSGDVNTGLREKAGNMQPRTDVLAVGRGVHGDQGGGVPEMQAEIAAERSVRGREGDLGVGVVLTSQPEAKCFEAFIAVCRVQHQGPEERLWATAAVRAWPKEESLGFEKMFVCLM
jgi:hypothetical protein